MKRVLIGGFLSLIGTIWGVAVLVFSALNPVDYWDNPPGRLFTTIMERGLLPVYLLALVMVGFGLGILVYEFFRKEKKQ